MKNINQDLSIIGVIFTLIITFGLYINSSLESVKRLKMISQSIEVIEEQDKEIKNYIEMLASMNKYADELELEITQMQELETLLKDLRSSWTGK